MSECLEMIQRIRNDYEIKYDNLKNELDRKNIISMCNAIEKELKAMDILRQAHHVGVFYLTKIIDYNYPVKDSEYRIEDYESFKKMSITREDYYLLKERLKDGKENR